jgi:NAD(P)-dependent dehydrogenase (short-subunit alcohol dehydrogenase family)
MDGLGMPADHDSKGETMGRETRRVSVVTGAGGGMGLAVAQRLGRRGDRVVLAELNEAGLKNAASQLRGEGVEAQEVLCDIADRDSVRALAEACAGAGELAALVHTAGLSPTMADAETILRVNLIGTALLVEAFLPLTREGSVAVLVASQAGHLLGSDALPEVEALLDDPLQPDLFERLAKTAPVVTSQSEAAYSYSKRAVIRMAERLAPAWGDRGARIASLSPGIIDTSMGHQELESQPFMSVMIEKTPLKRMGRADEIASVVDFLCSEGASFITGTDILVDGGGTGVAKKLMSEAFAGG